MPVLKHRGVLRTFGLLIAAAALYLWGAAAHAHRLNADPNGWDQPSYLNTAISLKASGYSAVTNRNQMPLYPLYLSAFYSPGLEPMEFFARAKVATIALSLALLAAVYLPLRRRLPRHPALNVFLITVFTVFMFKSPYVQADLLYYVLAFLAFLAMLDSLARPTLGAGLRVGLLSALAWLTKASNLPVLALFVLALALTSALRFRRSDARGGSAAATCGAACLAVFLVVLAPYLATSRRHFGSYFYNVNTSFYTWHDSWRDAMAHERSATERGLRTFELPAEERVGPVSYLRGHALSAVLRRVFVGAVETILVAAMSFGYFEYAAGYVLFAAVLLAWKWREALAVARERAAPASFAAAFLLMGLLLCGFYVPIAPGPRFALSYFLPLMFVCAAICERLGRDAALTLRGRRVNLLNAFNVFMSIVLALDVAQILAKGLFEISGGS